MNKSLFRTSIVYMLFLWVLAIVQFVLPDYLSIFGIKPDLLFVFSILSAYLYGSMDAIIIGLLAGFIKDAFFGRVIGLGMLTCLLCAMVATVFLKKILSRSILLGIVQVVFATILYNIILSFISITFYSVSITFEYLLWIFNHQIFPAILTNLIITVPIYFMLKTFGPYKKNNNILLTEDI